MSEEEETNDVDNGEGEEEDGEEENEGDLFDYDMQTHIINQDHTYTEEGETEVTSAPEHTAENDAFDNNGTQPYETEPVIPDEWSPEEEEYTHTTDYYEEHYDNQSSHYDHEQEHEHYDYQATHYEHEQLQPHSPEETEDSIFTDTTDDYSNFMENVNEQENEEEQEDESQNYEAELEQYYNDVGVVENEWGTFNSDQGQEEWITQATQDGWAYYPDQYDYPIDQFQTDMPLEYIFDKRDIYDDDEEEEAYGHGPSLSIEPVTSEQAFLNDYMNIPEPPATDAMDIVAATDCVADPILKYYPEEEAEEYVSTTEPRMERCASIESFFRTQRGPVVQLYLYPGNKMISKECRLDTHIIQLKTAIGRYARVPASHLDMRRNRNLIPDEKTLLDLGGRPGKRLRFTVEINKRISGHYDLNMPKDQIQLATVPDVVRQVQVEMADGTIQLIDVTIQFATTAKPNLGGFFDQRHKKKFVHAETSIDILTKQELRDTQVSTGVQVYGTKVSQIQTVSEKSTQMEKAKYYVSSENDCFKIPRPYTSYEELMKIKNNAAVIIQKYWRRHLGKKERLRREEGLVKRVQWAEHIRKGRLEQRKLIQRQERERQENPKRLVDLELLYRGINIWRKEQEAWVNANRWRGERKAALASLAEIEADLLLDLEAVKNKINVQESENRTQRCFDIMGQPKRWLSEKSSNFITSDDGNKVHVRQLQAIYTELRAPVDSTPEAVKKRCALLSRLNNMTKIINTKMSKMLTELVTRELTFLRSNSSKALLAGVRKRICSTFFFLCQDPSFNPEAKRIEKIPHDSAKLRKDMVQCKGCRRMQHRDEFTIIKGTTVTTRCKSCTNLYRTAILRIDLNLYRQMLKEIRRDEMTAGVVNSVTFLMDAFDLLFLVDQIWHAQSALSGIDNRYVLRLCRWHKEKPWSPWNCVCLTDEEATAHLNLENLKDAYTDLFFHKVLVKQQTAKTYFEGIAKLMMELDQRITEGCKTAEARKVKANEVKQKLKQKIKLLGMIA